MLQVSTDYVFGGEKEGFLSEDDPAEPINVYGATKLAGEQAVHEAFPEALVVRVCWLYGGDRPGFPDQIVKKALAGESLELIDDKFSIPTWVPQLAEWFGCLLEHPEVSGVVQVCPSGPPVSWRDWGLAALEAAADSGILDHVPDVARLQLDECTFLRVPRPRHTVMSNDRFAEILGAPVPSWRDAIPKAIAGLR
jgi:dTDP-4-dehydrorhamnose reductase